MPPTPEKQWNPLVYGSGSRGGGESEGGEGGGRGGEGSEGGEVGGGVNVDMTYTSFRLRIRLLPGSRSST